MPVEPETLKAAAGTGALPSSAGRSQAEAAGLWAVLAWAQAYVAWAARQADAPYRLLSEAEWEYACRAGTKTRYAFGDEIGAGAANFSNSKGATTPVGAYPANAFGLCDLHGNAWEWTEDCWNESYGGAPSDGAAWTTGDCSRRVVRGGSWNDVPQGLRSAYRDRSDTSDRIDILGFRVARTL